MKKDYIGGISFILTILFIIGFIAYQFISWQPDKIVSEKYLGKVNDMFIVSNSDGVGENKVRVVIKISGSQYILGIHQPQPAYRIKIGNKAWLADAILNGGKSKLHHSWLVVEIDGKKEYYLLEE